MSAGKLHPDIAIHLDEIIQICREFGITRLEVFGSAVTGDFDSERSDLDLLIEFPEDFDYGHYFVLKERLESLLGREVQMVSREFLRNPYFIHAVDTTKQLLYAS